MTRQFARLFDSSTRANKIIATDPDDGYWFVHLQDAGSDYTAQEIADALNAQELRS